MPARLHDELRRSGLSEPFPIQAAVLPDAIAGLDILGRAPTGSGKTLAFGLPLVSRVSKAAPRHPTGLVLAPTRELADQIETTLKPFAGSQHRRLASVYGGVGYGSQRSALDRGADIVVACPGRLEDLMAQRVVFLDRVEVVVIDEADRMVDMGFLPAVRRILRNLPTTRQTMLFSATLDQAVTDLATELDLRCATHDVGDSEEESAPLARHVFWDVPREHRIDHAERVAMTMSSTFFFCRTRRGADRLTKQLVQRGVKAAAIHGGRSQPQRSRALESFRRRDISALVATDIAARGIHVDEVEAVVHFDLPADPATYLHRSGRTARAGAAGVVVSFVDGRERGAASALRRELGVPIDLVTPDAASLRDRPADDRVTGSEALEGAAAAAATATKADGTVTFFDARRGFGFITPPKGDDLFVHTSNVIGVKSRSLRRGQRVRFESGAGRRGPEAFNVCGV
jgi:superfamily II DNA/RNA helicase